ALPIFRCPAQRNHTGCSETARDSLFAEPARMVRRSPAKPLSLADSVCVRLPLRQTQDAVPHRTANPTPCLHSSSAPKAKPKRCCIRPPTQSSLRFDPYPLQTSTPVASRFPRSACPLQSRKAQACPKDCNRFRLLCTVVAGTGGG